MVSTCGEISSPDVLHLHNILTVIDCGSSKKLIILRCTIRSTGSLSAWGGWEIHCVCTPQNSYLEVKPNMKLVEIWVYICY